MATIFRRVGARLCLYLLGLTLFAAAGASVFHFIFANPDSIKQLVERSKAYDNFVDVALGELAKAPESANTVPLDDPEVQKIIEQSFSPQVLQSSFEEFIDGSYGWLEGDTPTPQFTIDFTKSKKNMAKGLGAYAEKKAAKLPPCSFSQIPDNVNYFELKCIPPGIRADKIGEMVAADLSKDQNFLANPKLTANNINGEGDKAALFQSTALKDRFSLMKSLVWILLPLAIVLTLGAILLSPDIREGLKRVGKSYISVGVLVAVTPIIMKLLLPKVSNGLGANEGIFDQIALPLVNEFIVKASVIYFIYGGLLLLLGIVGLVLSKKLAKTSLV